MSRRAVGALLQVHLVSGALGFKHGEVELLEFFYHRPALTIADDSTVDLGDRGQTGKGAGDKCLVGTINVGQAEIFLAHRDVVLFAKLDHITARNSTEAIVTGGGPDFTLADDEKMR